MTGTFKYGIIIGLGLIFGTVAGLSWAKNPSSNAPSASSDWPSYLAQSGEMGLLTATQGSQINIRSGPGTQHPSLHYGVVGDRVSILQTQNESSLDIPRPWHRVRFVESGAIGWVRGDFLIKTTTLVSNTCHQSLAQAKTQINNVIDSFSEGIILQENSLSPFSTRPNEIGLILGGLGQSSVLSSAQLMENISDHLIQNCESVSSVRFGSNNSGWHHVFGLINDRVQSFDCIDAGPGNQLRWGQYFCGL